ncbi:MAG: RiPP maturation radical SAM protein 1 [Chloroflexi bacterium]|nr:RiPP maturation radical SAM protein 1 [Chloroflexota bacterium]
MMQRVLLVNMPFTPIGCPSPALSLLKPLVEKEGVPCDVSYLNVAFYSRVDRPEAYDVARDYVVIGEWPFVGELFEQEFLMSSRARRDGLGAAIVWPPPVSDIPPESLFDSLGSLQSQAAGFIQECLDTINWDEYSIVGFTSNFNQHVASLALARRIKERWPDKLIVFGGANCDGVMGEATLRLFPFVDWVFMGEADTSFPTAVARWFAGESLAGIPGMAYRSEGRIINNGPGQMAEPESLPYPDFDDYFVAVRKWAPETLPFAFIPVELSRGCWWGQKSQCLFCGFNHAAMRYRRKSPERAEAEIRALVMRYGVHKVMLTDVILDMGFFKTLLPALSGWGGLDGLGLETKANLNREQVRMLASAGVRTFFSGIESLDTETLAYMRKGTTLLQNVQLLKWAREYGLHVYWNILYAFPGEKTEAYDRIAALIPSITHLTPPLQLSPVMLERYSPLFEQNKGWTLGRLRVFGAYHTIYPFDQEDLNPLAYFFEVDFAGKDAVRIHLEPLRREVELWRQAWSQGEPPMLAFERDEGGKIVIYDTRPCAASPLAVLEEEVTAAYLACDTRRQFDSLAQEISRLRGALYSGDASLRRRLDDLVERRLMLREGDWYLSLATDGAVRTGT